MAKSNGKAASKATKAILEILLVLLGGYCVAYIAQHFATNIRWAFAIFVLGVIAYLVYSVWFINP